jgi:hypothetical protein
VDLPHGAVARAFGSSVELPVVSKTYRPSLLSSGSPEGPGKGALRWIVIALIALLFLAVLFGGFLRNKHRATSTRIPAPATTLTIGQAGMLDGRKYRIQSRALIKCAQVARLYDWHEYALLDDESNGALLICGLNPGTQDYFLFRQVEPLVALTAEQAAAVRAGQSVNVNGIIAPVSDHFQSTVRRVEDSETNDRRNGDTFYGFIAQTGSIRLLVRWDAQGIKFYEGKSVPATEVSGAFNKRPRD